MQAALSTKMKHQLADANDNTRKSSVGFPLGRFKSTYVSLPGNGRIRETKIGAQQLVNGNEVQPSEKKNEAQDSTRFLQHKE